MYCKRGVVFPLVMRVVGIGKLAAWLAKFRIPCISNNAFVFNCIIRLMVPVLDPSRCESYPSTVILVDTNDFASVDGASGVETQTRVP